MLLALPPTRRGAVVRFADKSGYATPAGRLPGVTTILSATSEGKARLQQWLQRPDAAAISDAAKARGTWTHTQIETWINAHSTGEPFKAAPHFAFGAYWRCAQPWFEAHWTHATALEQPIYHPSGFAGSFDALGYAAYGDEPEALTLFDWKTSKRPRTEDLLLDYRDQLGAYAHGLDYCYGVRPERAVLLIARPHGSPDVYELSGSQLEHHTQRFLSRVQDYYSLPS